MLQLHGGFRVRVKVSVRVLFRQTLGEWMRPKVHFFRQSLKTIIANIFKKTMVAIIFEKKVSLIFSMSLFHLIGPDQAGYLHVLRSRGNRWIRGVL